MSSGSSLINLPIDEWKPLLIDQMIFWQTLTLCFCLPVAPADDVLVSDSTKPQKLLLFFHLITPSLPSCSLRMCNSAWTPPPVSMVTGPKWQRRTEVEGKIKPGTKVELLHCPAAATRRRRGTPTLQTSVFYVLGQILKVLFIWLKLFTKLTLNVWENKVAQLTFMCGLFLWDSLLITNSLQGDFFSLVQTTKGNFWCFSFWSFVRKELPWSRSLSQQEQFVWFNLY